MLMRENQVGINLRYFRECESLDVETMAKKLHLSVKELRALEAGEPDAHIPLRTLSTIYTLYGVNPEQLFVPLHFVIAGKLTGNEHMRRATAAIQPGNCANL